MGELTKGVGNHNCHIIIIIILLKITEYLLVGGLYVAFSRRQCNVVYTDMTEMTITCKKMIQIFLESQDRDR